ncbi:transmembrane amino acid transporter protein-domain-containing protein, partial [Ochromonadaceae sp. CCMP2298]
TFKTFFACLAYSIIIGDTFTSIFVSSGLSPALATRSNVIIALSSTVLLPLCSLKNLDALKYTSILGLLGTLYTAAFMVIRYLDGSYVEGGQFFGAVSEALRPSFDARTTPGVRLCLFTAYVAHYNAPKFFSELKEKTMTNYNKIVTMGFGASIALYFVVMWVGFLQFGGHCSGFILNNYATADKLATAARVAIGTGILCGYPLTFSALRDGVLDLARVKKADQRGVLIPVTVVLLALLTVGALLLDNVGKVVSFSGALIGSLLIYIIPATMNIFNIRRAATTSTSTSGVTYTPAQKAELLLNVLIALSGITVAVFGVAINLMS